MTRNKVADSKIFGVSLQKVRVKGKEICFIACMASIPKIPRIPDEERTPLVVALLEIIQLQQEQIQELRDEIARLKGQKPKPKIEPSKLEKESGSKEQEGSTGKRPGSIKREKTKELQIHETVTVAAERHIRIATEGALLGSILEHEAINPDLVILSDDAGQFDVLIHALCWIHAERSINKLIGHTDAQREALAEVRTQIWELSAGLKAYRETPGPEHKRSLLKRFDEIFTTKTCYEMLSQALKRIYKNKVELLLVLDRPEIPLHNNAAETDIREYVKKRIISGSTRSDLGRRCRDTFASLKKTCRKLGVRFWEYLNDRVSGANSIPWLPDLMRQRMGDARG